MHINQHIPPICKSATKTQVSFLTSFDSEMATDEEPARLEGKVKASIVCWILGLGTLMAFNTMLTVADYYYQIFPKYHPSRVLPLVHQPCAIATIGFFAYRNAKVDTRKRNIVGYAIFITSTLGLLLVDVATSGQGGIVSYSLICLFVGLFGVADGLVQGGIVGDLSFMCSQMMQSFFAGLAASGVATSILRLVTKAAFDKAHNGLRKGALLFLGITMFFQMICVLLYIFVLPKIPIIKHYRMQAALEGSQTVNADLAAAGIQGVSNTTEVEQLLGVKQLCQNLDYGIALAVTYIVTLSIFPGFLYENTGHHGLGLWYPLVLITMYNVLDLLSRYIPLVPWLKMESRKVIIMSVIARALFIPAFFFTAKYGDQGWMILLVSLLGLTNGYSNVIVVMVAPRGYKGPEQYELGNLLLMFQLAGVFSGTVLGLLWLKLGEKL